jgi:hypothetical protein
MGDMQVLQGFTERGKERIGREVIEFQRLYLSLKGLHQIHV